MACPHVSGVAALGLSYAAQLRRHFTADEFKALLCETTTPIDSYMTGLKNYYRYVADVGLNQPMQLTLANYRNQMARARSMRPGCSMRSPATASRFRSRTSTSRWARR